MEILLQLWWVSNGHAMQPWPVNENGDTTFDVYDLLNAKACGT